MPKTRHHQPRWLNHSKPQALRRRHVDFAAVEVERCAIRRTVDPGRFSCASWRRSGRELLQVVGEHTLGALSAVALEAELALRLRRRPTGRVGMPACPVAGVGEAAGLECVTDRSEDGDTPGDVPFA
jgi:hypothetical protein